MGGYLNSSKTIPFVLRNKTVSGTLNPDVTGMYDYDGQFGGKDSFRRPDGAWFIWWHPFANWVISVAKDDLVGMKWERHFPNIDGEYEPFGGATGTATV